MKPNFFGFYETTNLGGAILDIMLNRILSLLETDETGKPKHGAKAKFARSIGYDSGDIVSMWEKGSSNSYIKKLHEISTKYNVSLEWLRGETDDPAPKKERTMSGALSDAEIQLLELFRKLPQDTQERFPALLEATLKAQGLL